MQVIEKTQVYHKYFKDSGAIFFATKILFNQKYAHFDNLLSNAIPSLNKGGINQIMANLRVRFCNLVSDQVWERFVEVSAPSFVEGPLEALSSRLPTRSQISLSRLPLCLLRGRMGSKVGGVFLGLPGPRLPDIIPGSLGNSSFRSTMFTTVLCSGCR